MLLLFCIKFISISVMSVSLRSFFKETDKICVDVCVEKQFGVAVCCVNKDRVPYFPLVSSLAEILNSSLLG